MNVKVMLRETCETLVTYHNVTLVTSDEPVVEHSTGKEKVTCTIYWEMDDNGHYPMSPQSINLDKFIVSIEN